MMQGFGVHTFRLLDAQGKSTFVKFHWSPVAGTHSLDWDESAKISGADPDFHRRDLWEAIESGASTGTRTTSSPRRSRWRSARNQQVEAFLLQSLEHELGGIEVYQTAIECADIRV